MGLETIVIGIIGSIITQLAKKFKIPPEYFIGGFCFGAALVVGFFFHFASGNWIEMALTIGGIFIGAWGTATLNYERVIKFLFPKKKK